MLIQVLNREITVEYKEKINVFSPTKLNDLLKRVFEKNKNFSKNSEELIFYTNVVNHVFKIYQQNTLEIDSND